MTIFGIAKPDEIALLIVEEEEEEEEEDDVEVTIGNSFISLLCLLKPLLEYPSSSLFTSQISTSDISLFFDNITSFKDDDFLAANPRAIAGSTVLSPVNFTYSSNSFTSLRCVVFETVIKSTPLLIAPEDNV
jgi:hypothetical protein